jgi:hypothetical protein
VAKSGTPRSRNPQRGLTGNLVKPFPRLCANCIPRIRYAASKSAASWTTGGRQPGCRGIKVIDPVAEQFGVTPLGFS